MVRLDIWTAVALGALVQVAVTSPAMPLGQVEKREPVAPTTRHGPTSNTHTTKTKSKSKTTTLPTTISTSTSSITTTPTTISTKKSKTTSSTTTTSSTKKSKTTSSTTTSPAAPTNTNPAGTCAYDSFKKDTYTSDAGRKYDLLCGTSIDTNSGIFVNVAAFNDCFALCDSASGCNGFIFYPDPSTKKNPTTAGTCNYGQVVSGSDNQKNPAADSAVLANDPGTS